MAGIGKPSGQASVYVFANVFANVFAIVFPIVFVSEATGGWEPSGRGISVTQPFLFLR